MKKTKYLMALTIIFVSVAVLGIISHADDDVYVPASQSASDNLGDVAGNSSAYDGGSGSTINTSTQTPVEAYSSGVPDVGPSGPIEQQ